MTFNLAMPKGPYTPFQKHVGLKVKSQINLLSKISDGLSDIWELASHADRPLLLLYVELALTEACESLCIVALPLVRASMTKRHIFDARPND